MWFCPKHNLSLLGIVVCILLISGCGHSVKTGTNSEGDGVTARAGDGISGAMEKERAGGSAMASRIPGAEGKSGMQGETVNGGTVNGVSPYMGSRDPHPGEPGMDESDPSNGSRRGKAWNPSGSNGTDYGNNYSGVEGSGPDHGPVTGFGEGVAPKADLDPESWANAYLGNKNGRREFYGDPSRGGDSFNGPSHQGVNPGTWAEEYRKQNGGPSPEYVDPDVEIAHANPGHGGEAGGSRENHSQHAGFGRDNGNGTITESNIGFEGHTGQGRIKDIYFAFDSWSITSDAAEYLKEGAKWLLMNPGKTLTIEGHCDQRGTQDYNLVLGQKRAEAARDYLVDMGVQADRIKVVSYGKEKPFCHLDNEECFQENRRNHMVVRVN